MHKISAPHMAAALAGTWCMDGLHTVLVPTMGCFHAGHESLMRRAREVGDKVMVSLFVNPAQFGPGEDVDGYPRDVERDAAIAASLGVDLFFFPNPADMYAPDHAVWVEAPGLATGLCAAARPTHFRGVCTIVAKLFLLLAPERAIFGQKDWQQFVILRRMVRDLNMPVELESCPIVREADGLAMSSRNAYLNPAERACAPHLYQGLLEAASLFAGGMRNVEALTRAVRGYWERRLPLGALEYASFVDAETLAPFTGDIPPGARCLLAVAARLGRARLIDNILLHNA